MSTKNKLPFSNQFERGHSFNWAGEWKIGTYYLNDEYVTDFVRYENAILACRKSHKASEELEPTLIILDGKVIDVDSPYWSFVVAAKNEGIVKKSDYISAATEEDVAQDPSVIIGDPYVKIIYDSGAYTYVPAKELVVGINVGVPIMTQAMLDNLPEQSIPEDYILMAQESDITDAVGGNYLSILFSAIRKLQAEVAKLRNSFEFGIESYTNKQTAVSGVVHDTEEDEDEPLWTIDENTLSEIPEATIDFYAPTVPLLPNLNVHYTAEGYADINGNAYWTDAEGYSAVEDTKIFLYTTTTGTNINVGLTGITSNEAMIIPLYNVLNAFGGSKYNICVLVSRKMKVDDDEHEYGKNYIWITASDFYSNVTIAEGYYNPNTQKLVNDMFEIDDKYTISNVELIDLTINKFNAYSQYQDFSHEVIPAKPTDQDYKYKAAHLTIRKVDTLEELEDVEARLLNNELIYQEDKGILWIKTKNGLRAIGSGGQSEDTGMTVTEMIQELANRGLIYKENNIWKLSSFSDVTFVHNDTGTKFKFEVSADGQLKGQELPEKNLEQIMAGLSTKVSTENEPRGFIGKLHLAETGQSGSYDKDAKLNSDRVKIGAVYCPLKEDTKHGCSHGYIEIENTSNKDIPLEGCYLHFLHPNENRVSVVDSLPLTGILPKGSTYLIRCKKYADPDTDADVFIDVKNYDQEWYKNGSLLDTTIDQEYDIVVSDGAEEKVARYPYAFALTYGNTVNDEVITASTVFMSKVSNVFVYVWNFIDSLLIDRLPNNGSGWGPYFASSRSNTIIKNTFELDPAKQAYQALHSKDSSRLRLANIKNDIQYLDLSLDKIEFPLTEDTYNISKFAPKASFEHKNVCTDKSKIDYNKPNMVTCSFGIDMYKTRCFNWISAGEFDEYVFIKINDVWHSFESYTEQSGLLEQSDIFPRRKEFTANVVNNIYKRMIGNFPGDLTHYTAHKCIIDVVGTNVQAPTTFTYMVGRKDANGNPDLEHCSEEQTFTLYPTTYVPRIYQITDQQGFHWIEYQVWAAAAKAVNDKIAADMLTDNIIPVLINTGDMTQNGTRINEWFDYYQAGRCLFNHLEQMNVVGNNDLCNTDVEALGTGDDNGKSNGYYFHVFYCYEVEQTNLPLINNGTRDVYVPSLYHFDSLNYSFIMINSEITYVNCDKWFNRHKNNNVVNVYTGWEIPAESGGVVTYDNSFTSVYTMIYNMMYAASNSNKNIIAVCHEMPFTVITKNNLRADDDVRVKPRSIDEKNSSLIGSHTNQLKLEEETAIHWLSRLLEHFRVKLMIGGHKHTYACTFPLRENYKYYDLDNQGQIDTSVLKSSLTGPMTMYSTLEKDNRVVWKSQDGDHTYHTSKLPYTPYKCTDDSETGSIVVGGTKLYDIFTPARYVSGLSGGVTYLMCQATGYKLTSNKELPTNYQLFSNLIPKTSVKSNGDDGPDGNQKRPMFMIISMSGNNYTAQLIRIEGILNKDAGFTQIDNTPEGSTPSFRWASIPAVSYDIASGRYANWDSTVPVNLISI